MARLEKNSSDKITAFKMAETIIDNGEEYYKRFLELKHNEIANSKKEKYYISSLACKLFKCENIYVGIFRQFFKREERELFKNCFEMFVESYEKNKRDIVEKKIFRLNSYDRIFMEEGKVEKCCFDYVDFWFFDKKKGDKLYKNKRSTDYFVYINQIDEQKGFATEKDIIDDFVKHIEILKIKIAFFGFGKKNSFCFDRMNNFINAKYFSKKINEKQIFYPIDITEHLPSLRILCIKKKYSPTLL